MFKMGCIAADGEPMSQANGVPPATDREQATSEVSWRDDPAVQAWSRPEPGVRRRLPVGTTTAVAGLSVDDVAVVLVDGRSLVLPIPRAVALATGYILLDHDLELLRQEGVVVPEPPAPSDLGSAVVDPDEVALVAVEPDEVHPVAVAPVAVEPDELDPVAEWPDVPDWPTAEESPSLFVEAFSGASDLPMPLESSGIVAPVWDEPVWDEPVWDEPVWDSDDFGGPTTSEPPDRTGPVVREAPHIDLDAMFAEIPLVTGDRNADARYVV